MSHLDYCAQFFSRGDRVLDIGSGRGHFLYELVKRGFAAEGVEVNPAYIEESVRRAAAEGYKLQVRLARAEALPFKDQTFSFVNCAEVTEHVADPERICQEIYRVLKPGGRCYISFHNRFGVYDYHYHLFFINWLPRAWTEPILKIFNLHKTDSLIGRQKLTTMHYFTYNQAIRLLQRLGFLVEDIRMKKIQSQFSLVQPLIWLYRYFLRPFYFNTFHLLIQRPN